MRITVHGIVQGVGFRPTVHRIATSMGISGWVQNNGTNVVIEVDKEADAFVHKLREELPPLARLDSVEIVYSPANKIESGSFKIIPSEKGEKGFGIPTDAAVCDACLKEMFDPNDRRFLYPFINCTNCGARFTVIDDLPYDRDKTSMRDFPMDPDCRNEYDEPSDRRFHHQTISCPSCGPSYYLLDANGHHLDGEAISTFAQKIGEGAIGVVKSWGGMHICCTLASLPRLREWYRRKEKPFAIMVRDLDAVRRFGTPTKFEDTILRSANRPVVLIHKNENRLTEMIAPGLGNIGVFLPYSAMHHLLFHHLGEDALVMTSANVPGEPMVLRDQDALELKAEYYLLHNREIINRCDDTVLRTFGDRTFYLRKSRGSTPSSLNVNFKGVGLGLGAQENLCGAVAVNGRLFTTQYIGDGDSPRVIDFLDASTSYLRRLLGVDRLDAVGIDLHPAYTNRKLGKQLAYESGAKLVEVQHHWAHAASLMIDAGLDDIMALTLDGTGYGMDGKAWGGEILYADLDGFRRLAHLQEIPLLGGEMAVKDPRRLAFAISEMLGRETSYFTERESEVLRKAMPKSAWTTSFGRVLDALACEFDVCRKRSYDGEPAMKLERHLERGKRTLELEAEVRGDEIMTVPLYGRMIEAEGSADDKACSFTYALLKAMVNKAVDEAQKRGLDKIGLTGGVSVNNVIASMTEELVRARGLELVVHDRVPNGDGGISTGQCAIAVKSTL